MGSTVRRIEVAAPWRAGLPGAQYASAFELATAQARSKTPEQWARVLFEEGPLLWRWLLTVGWRFGLGLRLGPRHTPSHVQGWQIVSSDTDVITLAAASRFLSAQDLFVVTDTTVTWVTVVRYDRPIARLLWALAAPIHHLSVPWLFTRASR